jgi:hypothetical protein
MMIDQFCSEVSYSFYVASSPYVLSKFQKFVTNMLVATGDFLGFADIQQW